jgi:hypothetical protein
MEIIGPSGLIQPWSHIIVVMLLRQELEQRKGIVHRQNWRK